MATTKRAISEHDVVVLRKPVGAWAAGTSGAVISDYGDTLLVEITGPGGKTLDMIQAPRPQLEIRSVNPPSPDIKLIHGNIRARLAEVERLVEPLRLEAEQLRKIAAVFEDVGVATRAQPAVKGVRPDGTTPEGVRRAGATRSPNGAKRGRPPRRDRAEQALMTITEHPGITASELAKTMGIKTNYLYRLLPRLEKEAKITKHGAGYHAKATASTQGSPKQA